MTRPLNTGPTVATYNSQPSYTGWPETVVLTAAAIGLPFWLTPEDPLLREAYFDWYILAPLLLGLHYGLLRGIVSLVTITLAQYFLQFGFASSFAEVDQGRLTGWGIIILICGEYSSYWKATNGSLQARYSYVKDRFDTFTRYYHLLQTSHNKLEKLMAGQAISLRETLEVMRRHLDESTQQGLRACAPAILDTIAEFGGIQKAGLYISDNGKDLNAVVAARSGDTQALETDDPLLKEMLRHKQTVSIRDTSSPALYKLCIPITDIHGALYGAILVEEIQFFSLQNKMLTLLSVIAGHVGDLIRHDISNPVLERSQLDSFRNNIRLAGRGGRYGSTTGRLVSIQGSSESILPLFSYMEKTRRSLDIYLKVSPRHFIVLMPFAEQHESEAFIQRLERWWNDYCSRHGGSAEFSTHSVSLEQTKEIQKMLNLSDRVELDEPVPAN